MDYVLITLGMVAFIVAVLVLLARAHPGSGADLLDWKPTRDHETELQLEQDDIAQMIAAQNEYRRRRGAGDLTVEDAERMGREDQRVRERGRIDELARLDRELRGDGGSAGGAGGDGGSGRGAGPDDRRS
ncbi:MAG: hypothetical protein EDQ89_07865 [Acidobacteria bacterium]|nr:MAG: hypothetical protein EDQ89_07865 [Acidobacteriota bacterium]